MRSRSAVLAGVLAALAVLAACSDHAPALTGFALSASRSGVPFTAGLASPAWQARAAALVTQAGFNPQTATHAYPLLGVAQYVAVQRAEAADGGTDAEDLASGIGIGRGGRNRLEMDRGAVAGASAVVLTYLFPSQAQALEDLVTTQANASPGGPHPAFAQGEAIGRAVGADMVTRAQADGFSSPFTGTIPVGSGLWISNTTPATIAGGQLPGVTPWFLTSASQFRPGPPPAFGSAAFLAALGEIKQISVNRTAEQIGIATFWALSTGTPTTAGFWIQVATDGISQHSLSEREATHLYALLSATMFDAQIGCWDAKETYWFIRPWQADALITVVAAVGKPNHPSYPSGHSCLSASGAEVLSTFFPDQRDHLNAMVTEAGLSRMYGGIHYRFDIEAGQTLGRSVARFAIAADASGSSVLTAH
ncbi:MAG TPA: phosphatase PAP2 family protein [Gemmatimonadales bacterium]|nr:phosphatase PAP2 family protein [Gemmatimonadales bacterium]